LNSKQSVFGLSILAWVRKQPLGSVDTPRLAGDGTRATAEDIV